MEQRTVLFCGHTSSGKSSIINALAGDFVSDISLLKETTKPIYYYMSTNSVDGNVKKIEDILLHDYDNKLFLPSNWNLNNLLLIDLPGINYKDDDDCQNSDEFKGDFVKIFEATYKQADIIVYVMDVSTIDGSTTFDDSNELATFKYIQKKINEFNTVEKYISLIIVANKFDNDDNENQCLVYNKICENEYLSKERIFRLSSHKIIVDGIKRGKSLYVPNNKLLKECKKIYKNAGESLTIFKGVTEKQYITNKKQNEIFDDKIIGDYDNFIDYLMGYPWVT